LNVRRRIETLRRRAANVHARELHSLAQAAGWEARTGGKHITYSKPGRRPLPIPTHGTLKAGTVRKILDIIAEDHE
jgi:predicted RNA binding protein YcfA (HicA-like mRNA interferase family)